MNKLYVSDIENVTHRDGFNAATAFGAGPSRAIEEQAADLTLCTWGHLTPLLAFHYPGYKKTQNYCLSPVTLGSFQTVNMKKKY